MPAQPASQPDTAEPGLVEVPQKKKAKKVLERMEDALSWNKYVPFARSDFTDESLLGKLEGSFAAGRQRNPWVPSGRNAIVVPT